MAGAGGQQRDFFISYTSADRQWAEWAAWQLEEAGWTTVLQAWDFAPGDNFVERMRDALEQADRTIALLSSAYLASPYGSDEWTGAFLHDKDRAGRLLPVRVEACELPRLLATRVYVDLVGLGRQQARQRLLEGVERGRRRPKREPGFPGEQRAGGGGVAEPRFPAQGPEVSNLPARNRNFAGRGELLEQLRASLQAESAAAVVPTGAMHGLGGVGKTELALEFAHRFASDYDIAWWIAAELPTSATAALASLARRLGVEDLPDQGEMVAGLFERLRQRERWLLVYDNAEQPDRLGGLLPPGGGGHVLVTSRWSAWGRHATSLPVNVLPREESIAFLGKRTGSDDQATLDALAELLGDLPLALEEAAAYLEETQVSLGEYLALVRDRAGELFGLEQPPADEHGDRRRVATVWSLSLDRVHHEAPAAEALLRLCAFLAPDIPRGLPREQPQALPEELAEAVSDPLAYNRMLAVVGRYSLATVSATAVGVHRLVQAVIQARLGEDGQRRWVEIAVDLLRAGFPNESWEVATWPACERLLPHVLAATGHAERLGVAGEAAGSLLDRASTYLRERGQYRQAKPIAERALAVTEAALGPADAAVGWRYDELGRVLQELGDLASARAHYERALEIGEAAALGPDHPAMVTWRSNLGLMLQDLGDLAGARAQLERALAIGEATPGLDQRDLAIRHNNLGKVLQDLGDMAGARVQSERALAISEAALGPHHPDVAIRHNNLGDLLRAMGDLAGARAHVERALAISETTVGPDHPTVAKLRNNLGRVLQELGDLEGARAQYERALELSEAALGPEHPTLAIRRGNLGRVLHGLGDLQGARVQLERALAISEAALGPDHPTVAAWRGNLGSVLRDLEDLEGAKAQYEQALAISEAALGSKHPTVATWCNNLGNVLRDLGDVAGARAQYERALEISEAAFGPGHPDVAIWRGNLGSVMEALGDLPGAQAQYERALAISEAALGPDHPTVAVWRSNLQGILRALQEASPEEPVADL